MRGHVSATPSEGMSERLAGYELLERIGGGATADVHRAESLDHPGQIVAIKRLRTDAGLDALARVRREADALRAVRHPSVVRLLDVVPDGPGIALVLPFVPGGSLADRIARHPDGLLASEVADVGQRLAGALHAAHEAGVLHRDVKPTNVLFDVEGQPLLTDFGAALVRAADRNTAHGHAVGTAEYLDPAVAGGAEPDARADVYSLGVLLYEMAVGRPPFKGGTPLATLRAADVGAHVPVAEVVPSLPDRLAATIERAMARDPSVRHGSARDLALDLAAGLGAGPSTDTPPVRADSDSGTRVFGPRPTPPTSAVTLTKRRPWLVALAAAVVVIPLVAIAVVSGGGDPGPEPTVPVIVPSQSTSTAETVAAVPPEPCDGVATPEGSGEVILGDTRGLGCGLPVRRDGDRLLVPDPEGGPDRVYRLETDDEVFLGDWDCDGIDTLAVYRPSEGVVSTFSAFPQDVGEKVVSSETTVPRGGVARHVVVDGCDELQVLENTDNA